MEKSTFSNFSCIECGGRRSLVLKFSAPTQLFLSSAFRRFRIWPPYLVVIACTLILPLFGSGPLWPEAVKSTAAVCRKSWYYNLLFINNFQKPDEVVSAAKWPRCYQHSAISLQCHGLVVIDLLILLIVFHFSVCSIPGSWRPTFNFICSPFHCCSYFTGKQQSTLTSWPS